MAEFTRVASLDDLPPGELLGVETGDGTPVCLANYDGTVYAVRNNCTHKDFPLSDGELLDDCSVTCAWHGSNFDLESGRPQVIPAIKPVETYEVEVEDGEIYVAV